MDLQRQVIVQLKYWVYFCRAVLANSSEGVTSIPETISLTGLQTAK